METFDKHIFQYELYVKKIKVCSIFWPKIATKLLAASLKLLRTVPKVSIFSSKTSTTYVSFVNRKLITNSSRNTTISVNRYSIALLRLCIQGVPRL